MKTSTHTIFQIITLLSLPCFHLAKAQTASSRTPCEEYARRVEELSRACNDRNCDQEADQLYSAERALVDAQQNLENAQYNLDDWDASNKAELDGLPYRIGQAQNAYSALDDATDALIGALKNLYRDRQGNPGLFYSATEVAGRTGDYLQVFPGVFTERNPFNTNSREMQEAEARAQIRQRMSNSANGTQARQALNAFQNAQRAAQQSSDSIQQMEARREDLANERQALLQAQQQAQATLDAAEQALEDARNAYNDCLRRQSQLCDELARMRAAKDSCEHIAAEMCPIEEQLEGYHGERGSGSHEAAEEACQELGDAERALRRGDWPDAERHTERAGELADLMERRLATEECVNRLRAEVDALREELTEARANQPGDYSEAENEIAGLERLLNEAEDGMRNGDYSFAELNCTWWPNIPRQIRRIIQRNRSSAYRNAVQAARDQEQALRAEANARRQEMIRLRRKTDCIEILTLLENPNGDGPSADEQLMALKGELENLSSHIDQSMDLLERSNFSNEALERFMGDVQGHLENAIGALERYDQFREMAGRLQRVLSLFNSDQSAESNAEKFGNLMSLISDGMGEIADRFPILQGIAAYFTYLADGYSAAVEAILNIGRGRMRDALRGISEHPCGHILGLYQSLGFEGTVEHFMRESAPVMDNFTTPSQRQMARDLIRQMVALRLKECCRRTLSETTPPEQGARLTIPEGSFSCLTMSCDNTMVASIQPPWDNIELTGGKVKDGLAAILKTDKNFPWIPVGGGVIGGGVLTYILLQDDGGGDPNPPTTDPPIALNDMVSVPCGQTTVTINVLANDTGQAISITSVSPPATLEITIIGGNTLQISGGFSEGVYSFLYTITDNEGRTATAQVQVNVSDNEAPTITCPTDQSLSCGSDTGTAVTGMATATDLCSPEQVTITFSDDASGLTECSNTGTLVRIFTAFDPAGNGSQCTQTITILPDETPPTINCPANTNVECGESTEPTVTGNATGSDNCGTSVNINFIDDNSGLTGCNSTGSLTRTWTAVDDCSNQQSCEQVIFIADTTPPSIVCPANISIECQESTDPSTTGIATASDNCSSVISPSFEDDSSGLTGCGNTGTLIRVWTADDDCGNLQTCTQSISISDSTPPEITCPPATNVVCTGPIDPAITGVPSVSDNCSLTGLQPTFTDDDSGVVNCEGEIIRTWTVSDDCGNAQTCDQTITVMEQGPPIVTCPPNATVQCGENTAPSALGNASVEYFCGDPMAGTIDYSDDDSSLTGCNSTGVITRTWTALDDCGNGVTCQQVITVEDSTAPTITCPQNLTIQCDQSANPAETGTATAQDNCTSSITPTFEDDASGQTGCNNTGDLLRTWSAVDDCGNEAACVQIIKVEDTIPPNIQCPPSTTVTCTGSTDPINTGVPTASDNCTNANDLQPVFSDDDSGVSNCMGNIIRTWTVADNCGNTQSCTQTITVQEEDAPSLTCPPNLTVQCDDSADPMETGNASVTYHCGSQSAGTLTYDDDTSGLNGCNNTGILIRTWTATDSCGNQSSCQQTITVEDTISPTVTCPADLIVQCDGSVDPTETGTATGTDNCSASVEIAFTDDASGQNGCSNTGGLIRTWTATDSCGNASTCEQTITVEDTTVPTITCPANLAVQCDGSIDPAETGTATGTDNCSASVEITFSDDASGQNGCSNTGALIRTWMATDSCGNASTCEQTITVEDTTAPTVTCPANLTVQCDGSVDPAETGSATGTDNCSTSVEITFSDDASGQNGCSNTGALIRTWTATDSCGNESTCEQTITVEDTTAPTITCPANITVQCDGSIDPAATGSASGTDNCSSDILISHEDDTTGQTGCNGTGGLIRTWKAADLCGNESNCEQTITVEDTTAPTITCPPNVITQCNGNTQPKVTGTATGTDNCSATVTINFTDDLTGLTGCNGTGDLLRQWKATDDCANESTCQQTITLEDTTAPVITCPPNTSVQCNDPYDPTVTGVPIVFDNCTANPASTFVDDATGVVNCSGDILRTWTGVDDCGNSVTCIQIITITAPPCMSYSITILQINPPSSPTGDDGSINAQVNHPDHLPPFDVHLNGSFYIQVMDDPFVIPGLAAGMYNIQVFDSNGCPSEIITVEVPFSLLLRKVLLPLNFENPLPPTLIVTSGVEHPSAVEWQPVAFLPRQSNAIVFRQKIKGNNFWQLGLSHAFGIAVFENVNSTDLLLIDMLALSARQEFYHQFTAQGASFQMGGGLYQHYFELEKNGRANNLETPFTMGVILSARGEFKIGEHLNYLIPASLFIDKNGGLEFEITPAVSFVLPF